MRDLLRRGSYLCLAATTVFCAMSFSPGSGLVAAVASTGPTCGNQVLYKSNGTKWVCSFDDEFTGSTLSPARWDVMNTATSGYTTGIDCYTPANASDDGSALVLTATRLRAAKACGTGLSTQYDSGMVSTLTTFGQTDGRFTIRAKLPQGVGLQPAFWLLPVAPYQNGTYEYGEIDVAEAWGSYPGIVSPHLHYVTTPGDVMQGTNCDVVSPDTRFHTYTLEWTSTQMSFLYDATTCWTTTWEPLPPYAPSGSLPPVPFNQPFYLILQLAVDGSSVPTNEITSSTKLPAKMIVDYVRVWK